MIDSRFALSGLLLLSISACTSQKEIAAYNSPKDTTLTQKGAGGEMGAMMGGGMMGGGMMGGGMAGGGMMGGGMAAGMPSDTSANAGAPDSGESGNSSATTALPAAGSTVPFGWKLPKGWTTEPPSNMRAASFKTPQGGDVSIVILGGEAGGIDANVNRWRGQIGLSPQDPAQIRASLKSVQSGIGTIQWVALTNAGQPGRAILAATFPYRGSTIFIKNVTKVDAIKQQTEPFVNFIKSFKENASASTGGASQ